MKKQDMGTWEYITIEDSDEIGDVIDEIQSLLTSIDNFAHDTKQHFGVKPNIDRHWTHLRRLVGSLSTEDDNGDVYEFELVAKKMEETNE